MRPILGIDFATENTKAAIIEPDKKVTILKDESGNDTHRSAVYRKGDELLFGNTAVAAGESEPGHLAVEFKADLTNPEKRYFKDQPASALDVAVLFFKDLKRQAEVALGGPVTLAACSWPSKSTDEYRRTLHKALADAGLEVIPEGLGGMASLPETACPAIAYADDKGLGQGKVEYRLIANAGHGTFDVAIARFADDEIRLLTDNGDTSLGGRDIDAAFEAFVIGKGIAKGLFKAKDWEQVQEKLPAQAFAMRQRVEDAKKALSFRKDFPIHVPFGKTGKLTVTRDELIEHALRPFAERMKPIVHRALADVAKELQPGETVDSAILSGGTFRIPYLQECLAEWTGLTVRRDIDTQFAGVTGLAMHGHRLLKRRRIGSGLSPEDLGPRIQLVTPFDLGILLAMDANRPAETMMSHVLMGRNHPIPDRTVIKVNLLRPNQSAVTLPVVQCDGQQPPEKCAQLGTIEIHGIPPGPVEDRILVELQYNSAGLARIEAVEVLSQKRAVVEIDVMKNRKAA